MKKRFYNIYSKTDETTWTKTDKAILFFFPFSVVRPTQIFGIFKKKSNEVIKPFFTWNNSFNLNNEHSNSIEKNGNIFYNILRVLLIQICEC